MDMNTATNTIEIAAYKRVVEDICDLRWSSLDPEDMTAAAWAYYYFSVQFRENLQTAGALHPDDDKLRQLEQEECDTSNLSPWPGVAEAGERMNHDEYMRRTLDLSPILAPLRVRFSAYGEAYLREMRAMAPVPRALSIASYEDGGLESVFKAMLRFQRWDTPLLASFEHFLVEHIRFDSDPEQGHGALSRHLVPDDRIVPIWRAFRRVLVECAPTLLP